MHGSIMMYLFIVPFAFGFANYIVPLQIGATEMAFPRLNALSYWFFLFGGLTMVAGFLTADGAANFGWTGYVPLSERDPLAVHRRRPVADGHRAHRPVERAQRGQHRDDGVDHAGARHVDVPHADLHLEHAGDERPGADRVPGPDQRGRSCCSPTATSMPTSSTSRTADEPILWQHLFWFFGHPEVYIAALPFFGVITEVLPVFSRRPVFGYKGIVLATMGIAALSVGVWAHHMFATGAVTVGFFSGLSYLIAVPTGVKFFNWIGTMWKGQITFQTPMLFAVGFLLLFLLGGLTGVILASPPVDVQLTDTYFVVAHMHYVLFGGSAFALFAGIYYWFPKFTGRCLHEGWGKVHFWLMFVGFNLTFLVQHQLGMEGMPRRVADYFPSDGFTTLNRISTVGAMLLGASTFPFLWNVWRTLRHGTPAGDDPWGGQTLEWATTSPPPPNNFDTLPPIRSNRPVWDLHHPTTIRDAGGSPQRSATSHGAEPVTDKPTGRTTTPARTDDSPGFDIQARMFAGIGAFMFLLAIVYWFVSYEAAGTTMLALAGGLTMLTAVYLGLQRAAA